MAILVWDKNGDRLYETGVDRGVLFPYTSGRYENGVAWNGLTQVSENPSGGEPNPLYADNIKYLNLMSVEELGLSIEAYTYPDELNPCLGVFNIAPGVMISQQNRKHFGFSYRSLLGNDEEGTDFGYLIHLIFNCLAAPSEKANATVNDSPDAVTHSWDVSTSPVTVDNDRTSASIVLDSTKFKKAGLFNVLKAIEDLLYGTDETPSRLPVMSDIESLFGTHMYLKDSLGNSILDSFGNEIQSVVWE